MAKKKGKGTNKQKKGPAKRLKASRSPQGKQRQERRNGWETKRRQVRGRPRIVIKVPGGAVLRGWKKTKRKRLAHLQLQAEVHSQLRVVAYLFVLRIWTCPPPSPSTPWPGGGALHEAGQQGTAWVCKQL
ncbi:hypothetical protein HaLaN_03644, partial [Haematococcus lacustris]